MRWMPSAPVTGQQLLLTGVLVLVVSIVAGAALLVRLVLRRRAGS